MNKSLRTYYNLRAKEYEGIYLKPERQTELKRLEKLLQKIFTGKDVLEIACGTGYWTERIAKTARSIIAIDINNSVLELAKVKNYHKHNVEFQEQDLLLYHPPKKFEGLFGGFIWSHIKLQELDNFIEKINNYVIPNGVVVLIDNNFVEGSNNPIIKKDKYGNAYQARKLSDGSSHLIFKNFPTDEFVFQKLNNKHVEINFINLKYYWLLNYKTKPNLH